MNNDGVEALPAGALLPESMGPYMALMGVGFLVAMWGHGMKAKWVVASGIIMIFLATVLFPIALHFIYQDEGSQPRRNFQTPAPIQQR